MDPSKFFTFKKAIGHKTVFTRKQPQEYSRLIDNLQRVDNLIYNYKLELKRGPSQTSQIAELLQRGRASLKFVMLRCAEKVKFGYRKESLSIKIVKVQRGMV